MQYQDFGEIAAENIFKAAQEIKKENQTFFTKEEVKLKCKIGTSTITLLDQFGLLDGIQETAQSSIFDMM